jgi:ethanolamine permease
MADGVDRTPEHRRPAHAEHTAGIEYEHVGKEYLEKRALKKKAGWVLLWGLGVGAVISGDYFGWNFGLTAGGFWGLAIATVAMGVMYLTMMYSLAELAPALPHAGGPYSFGRQAFGPWGGYLTGLAVVVEYVITPAVIVVGMGGYLEFVFPGLLPAWTWWLILYAIFIGVNIWGVELALRVALTVTLIAAGILVLFYVSAIVSGAWSWDNLFNVPAEAGGSERGLPKGLTGAFAALPFAIWFFLAIEELPLASEEAEDVSRDMPRAMILGMFTLLLLALFTLTLNSGVGGGAAAIGESDAPLADGFEAVFPGIGARVLSLIGLTGLIASFHSIIYAYGRQIFALSRAGYFPRAWSLTLHGRRTPYVALIGGGAIGFAVAIVLDITSGAPGGIGPRVGAALLNMAVFGALISYIMMMASYIVIKRRMPTLNRPYLSPGGSFFAWLSLVLAAVAAVATFINPDYRPGVIGVAVFYVIGLVYFGVWSRHRLVAEAPEEEFALVEAAQAELEH